MKAEHLGFYVLPPVPRKRPVKNFIRHRPRPSKPRGVHRQSIPGDTQPLPNLEINGLAVGVEGDVPL